MYTLVVAVTVMSLVYGQDPGCCPPAEYHVQYSHKVYSQCDEGPFLDQTINFYKNGKNTVVQLGSYTYIRGTSENGEEYCLYHHVYDFVPQPLSECTQRVDLECVPTADYTEDGSGEVTIGDNTYNTKTYTETSNSDTSTKVFAAVGESCILVQWNYVRLNDPCKHIKRVANLIRTTDIDQQISRIEQGGCRLELSDHYD